MCSVNGAGVAVFDPEQSLAVNKPDFFIPGPDGVCITLQLKRRLQRVIITDIKITDFRRLKIFVDFLDFHICPAATCLWESVGAFTNGVKEGYMQFSGKP